MRRMIIMKKTIVILLALCFCAAVLSNCGVRGDSTTDKTVSEYNDTGAGRDSAADKAISEFNDAVKRFSKTKDLLSALISETDELLETIGTDESDGSELVSKLQEAKTASAITVPEMETDLDKINEQTKSLIRENENLTLIYDELRAVVSSERERQQAENALKYGIIVVSASYGSQYTYNSTGTYKFTAFTVQLNKIDPETGTVTHIRTFSSEDTHSCSAYLSDVGGYTEYALRNFNSDMTLMTAVVTLESGAKHIGWVDENGRFTDVSAKITTESDFGALTNHGMPRFFGDWIYFRDFTNTSTQIKRVPLNNLTTNAVEVMVSGATWNGVNIYPRPDGTVEDVMDPYEYYDSSMQYPARAGDTYDWISADTCIGNGNGANDPYIIYKYQLSGKKGVFDWYSNRTTFIPSIKNRINWNAVVSPDSNQVAFLSKLKTGTDQSTSLFLIPVDGGDPVKVHTDYPFGDKTYLIDWR